jgi:hypothetical protein
MNRNQIFGPVLVQVLLTLAVYILLSLAKARAVKLGQVDMTRRALHDDAWPDEVRKINNNIRNQFELPILFYAVCFALWALDAVGLVALVAAWLFAASRIVHAWIHIVPNYVPVRRTAFTFGWVMVIVLAVLATWD